MLRSTHCQSPNSMLSLKQVIVPWPLLSRPFTDPIHSQWESQPIVTSPILSILSFAPSHSFPPGVSKKSSFQFSATYFTTFLRELDGPTRLSISTELGHTALQFSTILRTLSFNTPSVFSNSQVVIHSTSAAHRAKLCPQLPTMTSNFQLAGSEAPNIEKEVVSKIFFNASKVTSSIGEKSTSIPIALSPRKRRASWSTTPEISFKRPRLERVGSASLVSEPPVIFKPRLGAQISQWIEAGSGGPLSVLLNPTPIRESIFQHLTNRDIL